MLGVATMIVVNSVMAGFSRQDARPAARGARRRGGRVVHIDGFYDSDEVMARIKAVAGDQVEAMAPTMETFGLLKFGSVNGSDHPAGAAHRHPAAGTRQDRRLRRVPGPTITTGASKIPPSFEVPEKLQTPHSPAGRC